MIILILFYYENNKTIPLEINDKVLITNIEKPFENDILTIKYKNNKYLLTTTKKYEIGDYIILKGKTKAFVDLSSPNGFVKSKYYQKKGIYGEIVNYEIIKTNQKNYLLKVRNKISNEKLLLFLGNEQNDDLNNSLFNLNIYYLISLSGIHIYFLIKHIKKILFYLNVNSTLQDILIIFFLFYFLLLSGFTTTLIRIVVYELLKVIKKTFYNNITNYSLLNLSFFIVIIIKPYLLFSNNLLIAYLIVSLLMIFKDKIDSNSLILSQIKTALLVSLIILPFNNKFNLISILLNPLLIILIVYLMFPITIFNGLLNLNIFSNITNYIESVIIELGKFNFNITLPSLNIYLMVLYFILLFIILINSKKKIISILLLLLIIIVPTLKKYFYNSKLYFLDVGQGDASVYISSSSVIVIDAYKNVGSLLKYEGVLVVDYLILSHSHSDHTNEANRILNDFIVKNVVISAYENYDINYQVNIIKAKPGLIIKTSDIEIKIISPTKNYYNSNNNSLVFILTYNDISVLYTGDIELEVEEDLLYLYFKYYKDKINILKVSHHGSNTSSHFEFIFEIQPEIAIISVGYNNSYKMPSEIVINNFNKLGTRVFRTDLDGTILYYNNEIYLL